MVMISHAKLQKQCVYAEIEYIYTEQSGHNSDVGNTVWDNISPVHVCDIPIYDYSCHIEKKKSPSHPLNSNLLNRGRISGQRIASS